MKKRVIFTHFTMKIIRTYLYVNCNKKILFVKKILAYCGYSPASPFFFLFSAYTHCDYTATNSNSENARRRMVANLRGSVGTGKKMSHVLGAFLLLDFTMLRPVLAWRAFWNLWTVYFFNFPIFFRPAVNCGCGVRLYLFVISTTFFVKKAGFTEQ